MSTCIRPRLNALPQEVYGCFLKWWYPQIIHFNRVFHYIHHPFWGPTPIFWKHPYDGMSTGKKNSPTALGSSDLHMESFGVHPWKLIGTTKMQVSIEALKKNMGVTMSQIPYQKQMMQPGNLCVCVFLMVFIVFVVTCFRRGFFSVVGR